LGIWRKSLGFHINERGDVRKGETGPFQRALCEFGGPGVGEKINKKEWMGGKILRLVPVNKFGKGHERYRWAESAREGDP